MRGAGTQRGLTWAQRRASPRSAGDARRISCCVHGRRVDSRRHEQRAILATVSPRPVGRHPCRPAEVSQHEVGGAQVGQLAVEPELEVGDPVAVQVTLDERVVTRAAVIFLRAQLAVDAA